ncbi:hypothetical protein [Aminobacterium mobile]|nr:hypothetical protein [Aminobacterium mobile]
MNNFSPVPKAFYVCIRQCAPERGRDIRFPDRQFPGHLQLKYGHVP